ncbi:hypothetical protein P3S67_014046 [Capsicum chacoense]
MKTSIFSTKGPAMAHIAGSGTGFLIRRNLLLTTHVILPCVAAAEAAEIRLQNGFVACLFPHSEAWKVYGTLQLANIVVKELPHGCRGTTTGLNRSTPAHILLKVDVIEGDGGIGTVLKLTFPPGTPLFTYSKKKFTVMEYENRVKVALLVEGGLLDHGFTFFQVHLDVIEKSETTCSTRAAIDYEVKEEAAANVSFVSIQTFLTIVETVANYLIQQKDEFFITSSVLDLTIVGLDVMDGNTNAHVQQPHYLKTCSKPNLVLGNAIYQLGYSEEKELTVGEGKVIIAIDNLINLSTDGISWGPGSAGFDVHGNLAFMVCDPMKLATSTQNPQPLHRPRHYQGRRNVPCNLVYLSP